MTDSTLSTKTKTLIENYKKLPIGKGAQTPYFNNKRAKIIGGLRAFIGKGTPKDIAEELEIISLKERKSILDLSPEDLKKFLVDHGLGVDCSGFAFHVLSKEYKEKYGGHLASRIKVKGGLTRRIKKILRPAESIGVYSFSLPQNSTEVPISDARAGDIVVILGTGKDDTYNHIMVIASVKDQGNGVIISYAHSISWPQDGKYGHGVRSGEIRVANNTKSITQSIWTENGVSGKDNYTLQSALEASSVSIRRLKAFSV